MASHMSRGLAKILALTLLAYGYTLSAMAMAKAKAKKPTRRHSAVLFLRVTPEHEALVKQAAELAGTSVSDWIRDRLVRTARREIAEVARYEAAGKTEE